MFEDKDHLKILLSNEILPRKVVASQTSWIKLIGINALVAGLEIASSLAFTFIPPLLLKIGYGETQMSIIFGIAPLLALLTVPSLGKFSDTCQSSWGRRRPLICAMSTLLVVGLISLAIAQSLLFQSTTKLLGMIVVAMSVVVVDYASQAAINPCESLMADYLHSSNDPDKGYLVYSSMLSLGSCIGYLLSALNWEEIGHFVGTVEQTAIVVVLVLFLICFGVTMVVAREQPYVPVKGMDLLSYSVISDSLSDNGYSSGDEDNVNFIMVQSPMGVTVNFEDAALFSGEDFGPKDSGSSRLCTLCVILHSHLCRFGFWICLPRSLGHLLKRVTDWPLKVIGMIRSSPGILQQIFWTDLFSWMAVMSHVMFCTDFVATVVFGGRANAELGTIEARRFDEGVRVGSLGLLLHSITAFLFAVFLQNQLTAVIGLRNTYIFGLLSFAFAMLFTVLFPNVTVLNVCAAISGIGFTVITSVPNTLITFYHAQANVYFKARSDGGGYGQDIAILDTAYYMSQIILSLVMGQLVEMSGLPHLYIIMASICGFVAAYSATKVVFCPSDMHKFNVK
ncbi:solute carrier family 45 member 3-like isoform X2 [Tigriopus californicus]|nr:solute carrier family 45 member 3-like isoform X2 [Tigriopus californicus]XP_059082873.1 solute carrier family 45 member 3-like isoform X2 [Tigriopus californicus]